MLAKLAKLEAGVIRHQRVFYALGTLAGAAVCYIFIQQGSHLKPVIGAIVSGVSTISGAVLLWNTEK